MGKHQQQGSGKPAPTPPVPDPTAETVPADPAPATDAATPPSSGMMKPDPYWGPHDTGKA
jgi:hypothetical protein